MLETLKSISPSRICMRGVLLLARPFAVPVTLLLHSGVGERFLGFSGIIAIAPFFLLPMCFETSGSLLFTLLTWAYILRAAAHYYHVRSSDPTRAVRLSRDPGDPLWGTLEQSLSRRASAYAESGGVILVGFLAQWLSPLLGTYLLLSGIAMLLSVELNGRLVRDKLLDKLDAILEAQTQVDEIREAIGQGQSVRPALETYTAVGGVPGDHEALPPDIRALPNDSVLFES
jgi:hypothetical protein